MTTILEQQIQTTKETLQKMSELENEYPVTSPATVEDISYALECIFLLSKRMFTNQLAIMLHLNKQTEE